MKRVIIKLSCVLLAICLMIGTFTCLPLQTAEASGAGSLTIRAGYFGYPYIKKAELSAGEIESLGAYTDLYTAIDKAGRLVYSTAYGVSFYNLLAYARINTGNIKNFNFRTIDGVGESRDYSYGQLIGGARYSFPGASSYYERGVGYSDETAVWDSAQMVESMLALSESRTAVDDYSEYEPGAMNSEIRFRLMIGQESPTQTTASESLYGIYEMLITYNGAPSISANDVEFKVGENQTIEATVSSEESELNEIIKSGLKYKSADESVVKVDENGKLTAVGKGETEITIYYDYKEAGSTYAETHLEKVVKIVVGEGESGSGGTGGSGTGTGDGDGSGSGGTGGGHGTGDGDGGDGGGTGGNTGTGGGGGENTGGTGSTEDSGRTDTGGDNSKPDQNGQNNNESKPEENKPEQEKPRNEQSSTSNTDQSSRTTESSDDNQTVYVTPDKNGDIKKTPESGRTITVKRLTAVNSSTGGSGAASGEGGSAGGTPGGSDALAITMQSSWVMQLVVISALALLIIGGAGMFIRYKKEI